MIALVQYINILILIVTFIGIPLFMITVVRLLSKIERRLERLEKTMNNMRPAQEGDNESF